DGVVRGHRIDGARAEQLDTLGVARRGVELDALGVLVPDALGRGRALDRAEHLAVQRVRPGDLVGVRVHQEILPGDEIRACEVDLRVALIGDRVGRHDHVDLLVHEHGLALGGDGFDELDVPRADPELFGHVLRDIDVHAGVVRALLQTQTRLVELDADGQAVAPAVTTVAVLLGSTVTTVGLTGLAGRAPGQRERARNRQGRPCSAYTSHVISFEVAPCGAIVPDCLSASTTWTGSPGPATTSGW